ncbi:MAG: hypothetical protein ACLGI3_18840 [Actinomycetes bacterium]
MLASGTPKEDLLLGAEEAAIVGRLPRALHGQSPQQALQHLLERLAETGSNAEFLLGIARRPS